MTNYTVKRVIAVSVVIFLALVVAWYFIREGSSERQVEQNEKRAAQSAQRPHSSGNKVELLPESQGRALPRAGNPGQDSTNPLNKSALYVEFEYSKSLREFVDKYGKSDGTKEAQFLASKALDLCRGFLFGHPAWKKRRLDQVDAKSDVRQLQVEAIGKIDELCGGDWGPRSLEQLANNLINGAKSGGFLAAETFDHLRNKPFVDSPETTALIEKALRSSDLAIVEEAGRLLTAAAQKMGGFTLGGGGTVNPMMYTDAWFLALCDLGKDCGPSSVYVVGYCSIGQCESSVEGHMQRFSRTPQDMQEINRIRQQIVSGVQQGRLENVGLNALKK